MHWLKDHGVITNYDDYVALPFGVLEDARMLMASDAKRLEVQNRG